MRTFKDAEARLAETLSTYESRSQQQTFAEQVEEAMEIRRHLVAQAGCGTGKSFGYLIPSILSAVHTRKRTIVSTATKALQDQIANGDLPFLFEHLGVDFTFAILKGRSNYLCLNKALDVDHFPGLDKIIARASEEGFNGEREDLGFEVTNGDWMKVAAETDDCSAYNCKEDGTCFAAIARARAKEADVVVVNHALYFTDLMVREMSDGNATLIGEHEVVVFDEAHEIEEYAAGVLGTSFTLASLRGLHAEIRNWAHKVDTDKAATAEATARQMLDDATVLWDRLKEGKVETIRKGTLVEFEEEFVAVALGLQETLKAIGQVSIDVSNSTENARLARTRDRVQRRALNAAQRFADLVVADFADLVRWVEERTNARGEKILAIVGAPVSVAGYLRDWLFAKEGGPTAVLTSATILVDGSADYISSRVGLDRFHHLDVGTPFDFEKQAALYVPEHLPDPAGKTKAQWNSMSITEIGDLIKASDGRALVLFTSTAQMRDAYSALAPRLPYKCLMQFQKPNKELAAEFAADTHSVLFATRSFMTGVDFQGETLSLVIIDKLPFPVPTEPLVEARCNAIKNAGGSDFSEYVIPVMTLVLEQAFGRLIRHRNDHGVVAILDPRLITKGYGKKILRSLPPARRITKPAEVVETFEALAEAG